MVKGLTSKPLTGRNFALTIILGVFIAIMLCVLVNLIVDYAYPSPQYETYCKGVIGGPVSYPMGDVKGVSGGCCASTKELQEQVQSCVNEGNTPVYEYNTDGCPKSLKECNDCNKRFGETIKSYNRKVFFVFAAVGFILIVAGLFVAPLLLQISLLPAGAFLVIEAAAKNFDSKLTVIIVFALLIVAAVYLALKKLR
ncbi:MAG: hypothetical protein PHH00_04325 [Candidatus Nanoarchaeia archaeon]|nr:hypothetical protein [Candidatus Nanoarchaeia archaeon]